ncbi:unnamed protein product [Rangifer tarandus platyrhynchus]|uniref:Uncharacterized protein n=1 Tax=Rangifer tarandus platyrhynchus TaxID=3082113 RepID=A0ACB1KDW6_RANTA
MQAQPFWPSEGFLGFGTRGTSHTPVLYVFFLGGIAGTPMELMLLNRVLVALWGIDLTGSLLQPVNPRMLLSHGIRWGPEKGRDRPPSFQGAHSQPFPVWPCTLLPSNPPPSSTWQAFLCKLHALSQPTALPAAQFGFPPAAGG